MPEREKVIKGLETCAGTNNDGDEGTVGCLLECPYKGSLCIDRLMYDALELLKEQEARINELEGKLRLLEYGDQDILQSGLMPAT